MRLYHATPLSNLKAIQVHGLNAGSYWTADLDLLDYYVAEVEEEGEEATVLTLDLDALCFWVQGAGKDLMPDLPGIQEPITGALGRSEDDILAAWEASNKDWQACLEIIQSLRCPVAIDATMLEVLEPLSDKVVPIGTHLADLEAHAKKRRTF